MSNEQNGNFIIRLQAYSKVKKIFQRDGDRDRDTEREKGNYYALKPTEHSLKAVEQITEEIISNVIIVDHLQFGFMLGGS